MKGGRGLGDVCPDRYRRLPWAALVVFVAVFASGACGGAQSPSKAINRSASPAASATPAPRAAPGVVSAWQAKGATQVPPQSVQQVTLAGIEVVNQTNGAVSQSDTEKWAAAFLRSGRYELWAVNAQQDDFLLRSGLNVAPQSVFAYDVGHLAEARSQQKRVKDTGLAFHRLVLRSVPQGKTTVFSQAGSVYTPYAWWVDYSGPFALTYVDARGQEEVKDHAAAGELRDQLVGGSLSQDPLLGDVWVFASDWDCTSSDNQQAFGSLCRP